MVGRFREVLLYIYIYSVSIVVFNTSFANISIIAITIDSPAYECHNHGYRLPVPLLGFSAYHRWDSRLPPAYHRYNPG